MQSGRLLHAITQDCFNRVFECHPSFLLFFKLFIVVQVKVALSKRRLISKRCRASCSHSSILATAPLHSPLRIRKLPVLQRNVLRPPEAHTIRSFSDVTDGDEMIHVRVAGSGNSAR
jgi:hypothetical protein